MAEIGLMKAAGAKAVATGRHWIADSGIMLRVLQYASALGLTVIVHAEDSGLAAHAVATSGETATRLGLPSAPACADAIAIARDIMQIGRAHVELQSLMRISYAVFCLKKKK